MKKTLIISVFFIILILILIIFAIFPLLKEIKESSNELILEKGKLVTLNIEIEKFKQFEKTYKTLQPDFEKSDKLLINYGAPVDFIKFLKKTAGDSNVLIEISTGSSRLSKKGSWAFLGFQLSLTGSFPDFIKFLKKMESSPYLIEFSNLNLKKAGEGNVNGNLLLKVYAK